MTDITSIAAALNGIKTATEIITYLRNTETAFKNAELKLKIADLVDVIAETKLSLANIQEIITQKNAEIKRLNDILKVHPELILFGAAYYHKNSEGKPTGDPFCPYCFEVKHNLVHIHQNPIERRQNVCPACKNTFPWQRDL